MDDDPPYMPVDELLAAGKAQMVDGWVQLLPATHDGDGGQDG